MLWATRNTEPSCTLCISYVSATIRVAVSYDEWLSMSEPLRNEYPVRYTVSFWHLVDGENHGIRATEGSPRNQHLFDVIMSIAANYQH